MPGWLETDPVGRLSLGFAGGPLPIRPPDREAPLSVLESDLRLSAVPARRREVVQTPAMGPCHASCEARLPFERNAGEDIDCASPLGAVQDPAALELTALRIIVGELRTVQVAGSGLPGAIKTSCSPSQALRHQRP